MSHVCILDKFPGEPFDAHLLCSMQVRVENATGAVNHVSCSGLRNSAQMISSMFSGLIQVYESEREVSFFTFYGVHLGIKITKYFSIF